MFRSIPEVVKNLLILNGLMFLVEMIFGLGNIVGKLGLFYFDSPFFQPYQIVTHMFLHGGFFHLFLNMFALWMFGSPLEQVMGPKRFLMYYLITGLGAAVLYMAVNAFSVYQLSGSITPESSGIVDQLQLIPQQLRSIYSTPVVGASGAVFGVLLAFGMFFPNTELMLIFLPIPIKAKYFVILYGLFELYMGVNRIAGDNIAHFAHLGGMLFGFILIKIWHLDRKRYN